MDENRALELVEGIVQAVIYQNAENGYSVLKLDGGEMQGGITVVGCIPGAAPGEGLSVRGTWMHHTAYGDQFKAEQVERRLPAGERAVFDYLASGAVRGIGAATAKSMVEVFGADALAVLEDSPERLTEIKGITKKRALTMADNFRAQMGMRRLLEFLGDHALPLPLAMPLFRRYGSRSLEVLKANPYLLVDEELGVDFSLADDMAISLGLEGDDP
ncbi:MAG: ATP-dependent RecD-like DNA helicase, partial [Pseudoflavonifractor sp.]